MQKLEQVKQYINQNKKTPSNSDKNPEIKSLGYWISDQKKNYEKNEQIMRESEIRKLWEEFTQEYAEYFLSNTEIWMQKLEQVKQYINQNEKTPSAGDKNPEIKSLGQWISMQKQNYEKNEFIMKEPEIRKLWQEFTQEYLKEKKPARKSTKITPTELKEKSETEQEKAKRKLSQYQELCKKMATQHSQTTSEQFAKNPGEWHEYHDARDFSFEGYVEQEEIPVNKIIRYLQSKEKRRLNILDLGCGRNKIKTFFEGNRNFNITGYDHVSYNGSIACDISELPEDNESVSICIFSQSLMGSNWQSYIREAKRVLMYNGELIISESVERYNVVKGTVVELGFTVLREEYEPTNRWFYIYGISN
jgi:ribosomal RNA-processing protein 8